VLADADEASGLAQIRIRETEEGCGPAPPEDQNGQQTQAQAQEQSPTAPGGGPEESTARLTGAADLVCAFNSPPAACTAQRAATVLQRRGGAPRATAGAAQTAGGGGRGGACCHGPLWRNFLPSARSSCREFGDFEVKARHTLCLLLPFLPCLPVASTCSGQWALGTVAPWHLALWHKLFAPCTCCCAVQVHVGAGAV